MAKPNSRLNLLIPALIKERFDSEVLFLRLGSRVGLEPAQERELKSKADLLRWSVELYCAAVEMGEQFPPLDRLRTETVPLPFFLSSSDRGLWNYAIKNHYANSYHDLASLALWRYFSSIDERSDRDEQSYRRLNEMPSDQIITALKARSLDALIQTA